jgi:hypothetical protein
MLSGSTHFTSGKVRVRDFIAEVVAILGFSAVRNKDLFTHLLFADKLYHSSKPSKKIFAINKIIESVTEFDVIGKPANYQAWADTLINRVKKKSLMFLIADFVGDINLSVLAKKHDLVVIIVRDKFVENPKPLGELLLLDPGYLKSFEGNIDEMAIKAYKEALRENDIKLTKHLRKVGLDLQSSIHIKSPIFS